MATNNDAFDIFDPTGVLKTMRNENMDAWAKMMVQFVQTEAYAEATGAVLDTWLANSGPLRKSLEHAMSQTLVNLKLPNRDEVTRLAERLTNIEFRLDDLDAKLDEVLAALRGTGGRGKKSKSQEVGE